MANTCTKSGMVRFDLDGFTPEGRLALRRWYRLIRMDSRHTRFTAHELVACMGHGAVMGRNWHPAG